MEEEANQLYQRRPQMTGQARDEEVLARPHASSPHHPYSCLCHVVFDIVHPPLLQSSFSSTIIHLPTYSLCLLIEKTSSHYMSVVLSCTFLEGPNAVGMRGIWISVDQSFECVLSNVISVTRDGGVQFPEKNVTLLEWFT